MPFLNKFVIFFYLVNCTMLFSHNMALLKARNRSCPQVALAFMLCLGHRRGVMSFHSGSVGVYIERGKEDQ